MPCFGLASVVWAVAGRSIHFEGHLEVVLLHQSPFGRGGYGGDTVSPGGPRPRVTKLPTKVKLTQLDIYGTAMVVPGSVCLILALQWGGLTYPVSLNLLMMV